MLLLTAYGAIQILYEVKSMAVSKKSIILLQAHRNQDHQVHDRVTCRTCREDGYSYAHGEKC
jgi:hypothetical protein